MLEFTHPNQLGWLFPPQILTVQTNIQSVSISHVYLSFWFGLTPSHRLRVNNTQIRPHCIFEKIASVLRECVLIACCSDFTFRCDMSQKRYSRADNILFFFRSNGGFRGSRNFLYTNCKAHGSLRKINKYNTYVINFT